MPRTECYCGESIKAFIVFGAANLFLEIGVKLIVIVHDYVIIFCSLLKQMRRGIRRSAIARRVFRFFEMKYSNGFVF